MVWSQDELKLNYLKANLDMADVILLEGFEVLRLADSKEVRIERQNTEDFELEWNKTWAVNIDTAKACFPYEHQFTEAIQNELFSIRRWLRELHPSKAEKRLPSDLVIKVRTLQCPMSMMLYLIPDPQIKEWIFEIGDDPFEVRLRDNYELLEDEYKESLKRQAMLDAKVQKLCISRPLLPQDKVEELYASLNKKNAEIYVQRSKQMQRAGPARTRLFAWTMQDLQILALADPSIDGMENATTAIRQMDAETLWPEDGSLEFSTLWVRGISVKCAEWKFQLRDFPQPLLLVENLNVWGRFAGAEALAPPRARRTVTIGR